MLYIDNFTFRNDLSVVLCGSEERIVCGSKLNSFFNNSFFCDFFCYNFFNYCFFNNRNKFANSCNEFFIDNYTESFSECVDFVNFFYYFFNYFFSSFFNYFFGSFFYCFFSSFFYYFFGSFFNYFFGSFFNCFFSSFFYCFFCGYEKSEESFNEFGGNFNAAESCYCVNGFSVKNYFFNDLTFFFGNQHNASIIRCDFFDYSFFRKGSYGHCSTRKSCENKGKGLFHFIILPD